KKTGESGDMDSYERISMMRSFFHSLGYTSHLKQRHEPAGKSAEDKKSETSALSPQATTLISGFHSILEQIRPGKEQRDELAARINRRLVLCESQLKDANVRYERLEAHGLDYMGKAMIARQAIAMQSPVEIVLPSLDNEGERFYGIPKSLDKEGNDSVLVISPFKDSGGKRGSPMRIPLGKISLLRRIKKSIFE
ncbi:MAG: hypothetical protein LBH97_05925, partial [Treponema sp.]|nr:hypothetical protein [Treponema sp.]